MIYLKWMIVVTIGFAGGAFVSAGLFTLTTSLGIVTRLAQVTRTAGWIHKYETAVIWGSVVGYAVWILMPSMKAGMTGVIIFGLFSGVYVGCLIGAVAEILNAFPVFFRRLHLKKGTAAAVAALALGKLTGIILQYLF